MAEIRLGDILDDHCGKCSMLTNHSVVTVSDEKVDRVRCRTCYYEHKYRHGKGGRKKANKTSDLFDQVLGNIDLPGSDS